jgi:hypothetical protein
VGDDPRVPHSAADFLAALAAAPRPTALHFARTVHLHPSQQRRVPPPPACVVGLVADSVPESMRLVAEDLLAQANEDGAQSIPSLLAKVVAVVAVVAVVVWSQLLYQGSCSFSLEARRTHPRVVAVAVES